MGKKKNEVKNPAAIAGAIGAVIIFSALGDGELGGIAIGVILLVIAAIIAIVKVAAVQQKAGGANSAQGHTPYAAPSKQKTQFKSPAQGFDFRSLRSTAMTGDVHTEKKNKYIAQLDGFLANGIIDRSEYNYLISRYKRKDENS